MTNAVNTVSPPRRPVGVWIMSILNLLISGVFPILTAIAFVLTGSKPSSLFDAALVLLQAGLGVAIAWAAIGAWQGKERSRKTLLTLLIISHSLQIVSNLIMLVASGIPSQFMSGLIGAVVRSAFWIGINLWYFGRYETREWYREVEAFTG